MARQKKRIRDIPFPLRLPPQVYQRVKEAAERQDESMNALIARLVSKEYGPKDMPGNTKPAASMA